MLSLSYRRAFTSAFGALQTRGKTIDALQAAFKDPSSPFYLPPGTQGPASPDPPCEVEEPVDPLKEATQTMIDAGFDPSSFWEQRIVWGDQDAFQHVNNVRYARFFESSRMKWVMSIGHQLGGQAKADAMVKGQGVSLILKSIEVRFRRPVTYPDTLLIGYRPKEPSLNESSDPSTFYTTSAAYSIAQKTVVAISNETLVWYDYDRLKKCAPDEETRAVVFGRVKSQK
ncbi:hypothetical protein H0H92_003685 [Tricholoma furcatifolium]|nr:hypothetical protein H0H92_003685 [Tricholoma furcatifolium]